MDMCYKLRSLVETPRQTMQEEEDFLNGFSTQSLLNYPDRNHSKSLHFQQCRGLLFYMKENCDRTVKAKIIQLKVLTCSMAWV